MQDLIVFKSVYLQLVLMYFIKITEYKQCIKKKSDKEFIKACKKDLKELSNVITSVEEQLEKLGFSQEQFAEVKKDIEVDPLFVIIEQRLGKNFEVIN